MKTRILIICIVSIMLHLSASAATRNDKVSIPPSLDPWKGWVLHGQDDLSCPRVYNTGTVFRCIWPSRLKLELEDGGGQFTQHWLVFRDGRIPLPGSGETWPQDIRANGKAIPVVEIDGTPSAFLEEGEYKIEGAFVWKQLPVTLSIPEASGLVELLINGKKEKSPLIDKKGRLWLQKRRLVEIKENRIDVKVYRLLNDTIPTQVTTDFKINVSGETRNVKLARPVLDSFITMDIKSPLPARLSHDGMLTVQVRPGNWDIRVTGRSPEPVHEIRFDIMPYGQEIWAFRSQNHLRMVKVEGVPPIDPSQTGLPPDWKNLPAFVIQDGHKIVLNEIRRGDPDPAPDRLNLVRTWWLDFDGNGYTIHDRINGTMSRQWYLAMNHPAILGRVSVDGIDQLITSQGEDKKPGVELRKGRLELQADSRIETDNGSLPAVGWAHDFQSLSGTLNLPPGWLLVRASGVDTMPGTWFQRWTLLDLFIVLIITLAVFKLWNWKWCLAAFFALFLTYHEPGAPRLVWLHLLAASALLKFLPEGWFKKIVKLWRLGAAVSILVIAVPFAVQQVRFGIYPQLEPVKPVGWQQEDKIITGAIQKAPMEMQMETPSSIKPSTPKKARLYGRRTKAEESLPSPKQQIANALLQDPNALIQTGPGLPAWKWRTFSMRWNGPVKEDQEIQLWLLPPSINLLFAFVRVLLLALLIFILLDMRTWKMPKGNLTLASIVFFMLLLPGMTWAQTRADGFPPQPLLDQLRERLTAKPDCLPRCADSPRMKVDIDPDTLRILLDIHAAAETALPLPGASEYWRAGEILMDGEPAKGLATDGENRVWIFVKKGIHRVLLTGNISGRNEFQINLPLKPHRVSVENRGWNVQGVDKNGYTGGSIKFTRKRTNRPGEIPEITGAEPPPFLGVRRVLSLGLDWRVLTTVTRLTKTGAPVVIQVPLLKGESVTTEGIRVEDRQALIQMGPGMKRIAWESTLEQKTPISLKAPESVPWTEIWVLDTSPIWHCELSGIAVTHHQDRSGNWKPQWQPWPGEGVEIHVSRPKAIKGRIKTIDRAELRYTPGKRFGKVALSVNIRSSQGGQHNILLPEGARLQGVMIKGVEQPVKPDERRVLVPLSPGRQSIDILWHEDVDSLLTIRTPHVNIGQDAVNADVVFEMPRDRWILAAFGPRLGPAVLFWSYLIVIMIAAAGLGRISWTPLKTRHWVLLGLGLTQVHPLVAILIISWLLALGLRKSFPAEGKGLAFNAAQILLAIWTLAAMLGLYTAIQKGLLGLPGMQVTGNGSSHFLLHWTQDRIAGTMPDAGVISLPMFVFRILMLLWALWLAFSLLKWFKWGWQCFSEGGLWRKISWRKKKTGDVIPPEIPE